MAKAQTTSENPQGEVSQQDTPVLPMQYDVRIHLSSLTVPAGPPHR